MQLWDISPPLGPATPVYPGDPPYRRGVHQGFSANCPVEVSTLSFSAHFGAHVDAPRHWDAQGSTVGELPLHRFIGPCQLIELSDLEALITLAPRLPARLLVRTGAGIGASVWPDLPAEQIHALAQRGVDLIGIDTPSIDRVNSTDLPAHQAARLHGLIVLEGLQLDTVEPGDYELIALPLKLIDAEASPVRAVLRRTARPDSFGAPCGA